MKWLFYGQGAMYIMIGPMLVAKPTNAIPQKHKSKLSAYGTLYSQLLGPCVFSFGLASILMANQPDNEAKAIFSLGWLGYHIGHTIIYIQKYLEAQEMEEGEPMCEIPLTPTIIHGAFSVAFIYYLYKNNFDLKGLLF